MLCPLTWNKNIRISDLHVNWFLAGIRALLDNTTKPAGGHEDDHAGNAAGPPSRRRRESIHLMTGMYVHEENPAWRSEQRTRSREKGIKSTSVFREIIMKCSCFLNSYHKDFLCLAID